MAKKYVLDAINVLNEVITLSFINTDNKPFAVWFKVDKKGKYFLHNSPKSLKVLEVYFGSPWFVSEGEISEKGYYIDNSDSVFWANMTDEQKEAYY